MLGPRQSFFVRIRSGFCGSFNDQRLKQPDLKMVRKVWLGFGKSYIVERFDGSLRWNFHGYYGKLKEHIKEGIHGCKKIEVNLPPPINL